MNPFSEVGREINELQSEVQRIKSSLYNYVESCKLQSVKDNLNYLEGRVQTIENKLSWIEEAIQGLKDRESSN